MKNQLEMLCGSAAITDSAVVLRIDNICNASLAVKRSAHSSGVGSDGGSGERPVLPADHPTLIHKNTTTVPKNRAGDCTAPSLFKSDDCPRTDIATSNSTTCNLLLATDPDLIITPNIIEQPVQIAPEALCLEGGRQIDVGKKAVINSVCDNVGCAIIRSPLDMFNLQSQPIETEEVERLRILAVNQKRNRMLFFNNPDGLTLRLCARRHEQRQQKKERYCSLCGVNTEGHRGRRSTFKCSLCAVHLCVRTYTGLQKSCWDAWHSLHRLSPRRAPLPAQSVKSPSRPDMWDHSHLQKEPDVDVESVADQMAATQQVLPIAEVVRLRTLAIGRKRNRLSFFNGDDGVRLRLSVVGHEQRQRKERYCALCSSNKKGLRGRRSTFKCSLCEVHLCVRTYADLGRNCWDTWHCLQVLEARKALSYGNTRSDLVSHCAGVSSLMSTQQASKDDENARGNGADEPPRVKRKI